MSFNGFFSGIASAFKKHGDDIVDQAHKMGTVVGDVAGTTRSTVGKAYSAAKDIGKPSRFDAGQVFDDVVDTIKDEADRIIKQVDAGMNGLEFDPNERAKSAKYLDNIIYVKDKEDRSDIVEKIMPVRFQPWVGGTVVAGAAALEVANVGKDVADYQHARKVGPLSYEGVMRQVGGTPSRHDAQFVQDLPDQLYSSGVGKVADFAGIHGTGMVSYDDGNAGGDLVFAMHNLR